MSYFDDNEDRIINGRLRFRPRRADTELDDEDGITCRRCGTSGLYWQTVTTADGRDEKSALFDSHSKRPHKCEVSGDAFSEVKE